MSQEARPSPPFEGANVLLYGGGQGIGQAVALEFARPGARVAIAAINVPGAEETAAAIRAAGGEAAAFACDVTREDLVADVAAEAERALGEIDIVMNNVGVILNGNPEDIPTS